MNQNSKSLTITYYAILREQRGLSEESIESTAATPGELYEALHAEHGFSLDAHQLKVVINDAFQPWDTPLSPGDQVVFIPPVAGG